MITQHQRTILAESLSQLDYPILSKHAMTADDYLTKSYVKLAWDRAARKQRYDILGKIYQSNLI